MKKLMTLMLGLTLFVGATSALFSQTPDSTKTTKTKKKKKKSTDDSKK
jgi:hypothetical protein